MKLLFVLVALSLAGALPGVQVSPVEIGASSSAGNESGTILGHAEIWKFPAAHRESVASRMPNRFRVFRASLGDFVA